MKFRVPTLKLRLTRAYIMWAPFDHPGKAKFGIASSPKDRCRQLRCELGADVRICFWLPLFCAFNAEQNLLHVTRGLRCWMPEHSGKSEWRIALNPVTAVVAWLLLWGYGVDKPGLWAFFLLLPVFPFDFSLYLFILAAVQYAVVASAVAGMIYFIFY